MKKEIISNSKSAELRRKAEQKLKLAKTKISKMQDAKEEEVRNLLHELEVHQIELEMQNNELRAVQAAIEEARQKYFELYNFAPVGYLTMDVKGTILELNLTVASMLGGDIISMIDKNFNSHITRDDRDIFYLHLEKTDKTKKKQSCDLRLLKRNGTVFWGNLVTVPIQDENGDISSYRTTVTDINERKEAEEQIKTDLKVKTALLQELYHRTKNNMQLIASLLKMQARRSDSEYLNTAFKKIINKINAMSLVHQKLYKAKDLSKINLKEYIVDLVQLLRKSYSMQAAKISLNFELEDVFLLIDSAIPLSLILNELISNIFIHAFPNSRKGEISIRLYQENSIINLHLADNGIGFPADWDLKECHNLGLETMFSLIELQLKGEATYLVENGLKWHLKFQDDLSKVRV